MTPERFRTIVEAYGAEPRRWPAAERVAAQAWAAAYPAESGSMLAGAASLDAWLSEDKVAAPDGALFDRILAGGLPGQAMPPVDAAPPRAAKSGQPARPTRRGSWRGRFWWPGVALAGVGVAGGYAGALAVSLSMVTTALPPGHDEPWLTTGFGNPVVDWSEE
ncbi:hypothetical protein [Achromobacter aloeverae]